MIDKKLTEQARAALQDKTVLKGLLREAVVKADANKSKIAKVWASFKSLVRMIQAWARGQYREVPWKSLIAAVAGVIYFVNPFDLIPDFVIIGLLDDALVLGWVLSVVQSDLNEFLLWEKTVPARAEKEE
jgi:uncharacterized membrane protein YkvA (DUF1232 family)